ncbi:MAG: hypothetical protein EU547_05580, partial [Promethearchaeota archaeon]
MNQNINGYSPPIYTNDQNELSNSEIIDEMFTKYIDEYDTNGYYSSYYEPSLQATYYTLSILESTDGLGTIDQDVIAEFIMDHYNETSGLFSDEYSKRYLDTTFEMMYYPLSTLLEVNAYAILSL